MINSETLLPHHEHATPTEFQKAQRMQLHQYMAGYFDASGSITISATKKNRRGEPMSHVVRLDMERINPTVVTLMTQLFPSYSGTRELPSKRAMRNRWYAQSSRAVQVLETLSPYLKVKGPQVALIREFTEAGHQKRSRDDALAYKEQLGALNKDPKTGHVTPLETPYVAGFFDAHGSVSFANKAGYFELYIALDVRNKPLAVAIARTLGMTLVPTWKKGIIATHHLTLQSYKAKDCLIALLPFLRIKFRQAQLAIEFQSKRTSHPTHAQYSARQVREREIVKEMMLLNNII